ncbi:hypothetical protein BH11MYX2_BH11MYX2_11660 [soil metagenome]
MRKPSLVRSGSAALVLVGCLFTASCGRIDPTKTKDFLTKTIEKEAGSKPTSIDCPDKIALAKDTSFDCTAHYPNNINIKITMKQTSSTGDVVITAVNGVVMSHTVEEQAVAGVKKQKNVDVTVDCGDRMHPATPGSTFNCKIADKDGGHAVVVVKVKDETGAVDWTVAALTDAPVAAEPPK